MLWKHVPHEYRIVTHPTVEPVTADVLRRHSRVDLPEDDDLLESWISAARRYIETRRRAALITQTWEVVADCFPENGIELWPVPVIAISSVQYTDTDGATQTWSASNYRLDNKSYPARLTPAYGVAWPDTRPQVNAVVITFTAGFGATEHAVPETAKQAIRMLAADWIENREATQAGAFSALGTGVEPLITTFGIEAYR